MPERNKRYDRFARAQHRLRALLCCVFISWTLHTASCAESASPLAKLFGTPAPALSASEAEPNDSMVDAQAVVIPAEGGLELTGWIGSETDIDVFVLEGIETGHRVQVDIEISNSAAFDLRVAALDTTGSILRLVTKRRGVTRREGLDLELITDEIVQVRYIAIAAGSVRQDALPQDAVGTEYRVVINQRADDSNEAEQPLVVWLEFNGGVATSFPQSFPREIAPFSGEAIAARFAGQTQHLIEATVDRLAAHFEPYNVSFLRSDRDPHPGSPFATIFFGSENLAKLGVASSDQAIVFSEDLKYFDYMAFTIGQAAQFLANVAAHELAHVAGLVHTTGADDVMGLWNTPAQAFEPEKSFEVAPVSQENFPFGLQDGPRSLYLGFKAARSAANQSASADSPFCCSLNSTLPWE